MEAALALLGHFLNKGEPVLETWSAKGKSESFSTDIQADCALPIVVLVDEETASAAEIFAAVLQNKDRAVLIGCTTFGKGLVQKIKVLPTGQGLKYTVSEYKLPDGTVIQGQGVAPNIVMEKQEVPGWAQDSLQDTMLQKALEQLKDIE